MTMHLPSRRSSVLSLHRGNGHNCAIAARNRGMRGGRSERGRMRGGDRERTLRILAPADLNELLDIADFGRHVDGIGLSNFEVGRSMGEYRSRLWRWEIRLLCTGHEGADMRLDALGKMGWVSVWERVTTSVAPRFDEAQVVFYIRGCLQSFFLF